LLHHKLLLLQVLLLHLFQRQFLLLLQHLQRLPRLLPRQ
jgi:hypothetical protein